MRPLRLEMKGFSTYADDTTVDFTDVELAAFVGPTGSGKSSIIDAITFALYGSVARYDEKAVAPVINQLSNEARVRLDFELAGRDYTAVRVVRRTKAGGGTTKEARLESGDEMLAADAKSMTAEVARLLGLDFAQFNKTVVLPQGRFADFLHDKPGDRVELLRDLLGLGMYARVGAQARERAKSLRDRAEALESTLDAGADVNPERLAELQSRAKAIAGFAANVEAARPGLDALLEQRQRAADDAATAEGQLALVQAIAVPDGVAALDEEIEQAGVALAAAVTARDGARQALADAETAAAQHRSAAECDRLLALHATHATAAKELDRARLTDERCAAALVTAGQRAAAARKAVDELKDVVAQRRTDLDAAEARLRALGERGPLEAALADHDTLAALQSALSDAQGAAATAEAAWHSAAAAADEARAAVEHAQRLVPAAALAAALHEGDTCPVCRQVVHELPAAHGDVQEELARLRAALDEATTTSTAAEQLHRRAEQELTKATAQRDQVSARLTIHPDRAAVEARLADIDRVAGEVTAARDAVGTATTALDALEGSAETKQALQAEQAATNAQAAAAAVLERCERELADCVAALAGVPPATDIEAERATAQQLADALATARTQERAADAAHRAVQQRVDEGRTREQQAREQFDEARDAVAALAPPKAAKRLADAWQELVEWAAAMAGQLRDRAAQRRADSARAEAEHRTAFAGLCDRAAAFVERPAGTVAQLHSQLTAAHAQADAEAAQIAKELARIEQTRTKIAALKADAAVAQTLGNVLKADRFERWLLAEAVDDLVDRATSRLHELTGGQYSITAEEGVFRIVDHRNADEVRDARSLSGGETFLASLALALALADSTMELAAEGSAPLESIFLDEGFGSLDPDTLDVVAGSIEELGASGRMVGIVTHIRELAERMPTRFEVSKGASGSTVARVDA